MAPPKVGAPLPEIEGRLSDGRSWKGSDARGRPLVLYFYPKDFTSGCTHQALQFRDCYESLKAEFGAELIGISRDSAETHERFRAEHRLPFPLLSDPGGAIARRFGAAYLGGILPISKRITFVIDSGGIIRGVFRHEFAIGRHARRVRECLEKISGPGSG